MWERFPRPKERDGLDHEKTKEYSFNVRVLDAVRSVSCRLSIGDFKLIVLMEADDSFREGI